MLVVEHLNTLRLHELELICDFLPPSGKILEIGAGTGQQGLELRRRGYAVEMIDLPSSNYAGHRLCEITDYDGAHIPFPDGEFDVVFSSNVLEHVTDPVTLHTEIRRVLKPSGRVIHVVPNRCWRFWTSIAAVPAAAQNVYALRSSGRVLHRQCPQFGDLPSRSPESHAAYSHRAGNIVMVKEGAC